MFNLGFSEIVIIGVLALLLIGPKQLPEMARVLGRLIGEFKKATSDLSGGLLDIKSELQKPMRESMDEFNRMKQTILTKVEEEARRVTEMPEEKTESTVKINIDDIRNGETAAQDKDEPPKR